MSAVDVQDLRRRLESQISSRSNIDATWAEVEKWVGPMAGGVAPASMTGQEGSIDWERGEVWDSTAPSSASRLAANIWTSITNPAMRWARLEWLDKDLQNDTEAAAWLDGEADGMFSDLADSDFYTETARFDQDWVRFCTACFVAEAKADAIDKLTWKGLDFTSPPIRECYYEADPSGGVYRFWRVLQWTPVQIKAKFGDLVPPVINQKLVSADSGVEKMKVAYAIYRRPEVERKEYPLAPLLREVGSCYFLIESGEMLGEETGFYEMPVYIVPWEPASGSIWGTGPGIQCLPDVRYLNSRLQQQREAGEKAVDPAFTVTERGLMSDVDQRAGGMTVTRTQDDIKVFESRSNLPAGERDVADLRGQVRAHFWADELTLKLSPQMTATEVNARIDQMNRLFGPTLAALCSMMLDPMLKALFAMRYRSGRMAKMPASVAAAMKKGTESGEYAIKYQGPLSRAQRSDEVAAIERVASAAAAMKKMEFMDVDLVFNEEQALREIAKRLGTPATILYSEKDVKAKKDERRKMQAAATQAEIAKTQAEAANQGAQASATAGGGVPTSVPSSPPPMLTPPLM